MSIRSVQRIFFVFITSFFALSSFAASTVNLNSPQAKLVMTISKNQLQIVNQFQTPLGLTGFVVKPLRGGKSVILYVDKTGKYLVMGNIINEDGKNLSAEYTAKYITAITAKDAYAAVDKTHWFTEGSANAPHKVYIIIEPNCSACHMLFQFISPIIKKGQLQVRWIPVAFLRPDSLGKAARLMYAKTDSERVKLLHEDEKAFNMKDEEGGLKVLAKNAKDKNIAKAYKQVEENSKFFSQYFNATPVLVFKKTDKSPTFLTGVPQPAQLQTFLAGVSGQW